MGRTGITYCPRSIKALPIYICMYMYICIYVDINKNIHSHIHTDTHTLVENSVFNFSIYPINIEIYRIISARVLSIHTSMENVSISLISYKYQPRY